MRELQKPGSPLRHWAGLGPARSESLPAYRATPASSTWTPEPWAATAGKLHWTVSGTPTHYHSDGLDSSRKGVGPDLSRAPCSDRDRFSPKQGPPQRCTACSCRKYGFPRFGLPGACFLQTSQHTQTCPQFTARGRASFWRREGSQDLNRAAKVGPFDSYASGRQVPPFTLP